jgi:hypothetical protein
LLLVVFWMIAILSRVKSNLSMFLIHISFMAMDGEDLKKKFIHLFTCAYIVWAISSPCPQPLPFPHFQAEPVLPLYLILLNRRHKQ